MGVKGMRFTFRRTMMVAGGALAVAGLMAAYSYTTATVNNPVVSLSVVNTNQALLALTPTNNISNDGGYTASIQNGQLQFDFGKGNGGVEYGVQPGSTYEWDDLFTVTNNESDQEQVTINATLPGAPEGAQQTIGFRVNGSSDTFTNDYTFTLDKGASKAIDVQIATGTGYVWTGSTGNVEVSAVTQ